MGHARVDVDATQERARQFVANTSEVTREMRRELGWNVREFDISLLRQIRHSSALSLVLGAGASMAAPCNAPSWQALVEGLLRQTIGRVMELWLPKPQDLEQLPPEAPRGLVMSTKRYNADEEETAVEVLQRIEEAQRNDQSVDADILMRGAHHGVSLFPKGGNYFMGWDGIITYNYDDFMEQALLDLQIPSAAIAMRGDEIAGDPNRFARSVGPANSSINKDSDWITSLNRERKKDQNQNNNALSNPSIKPAALPATSLPKPFIPRRNPKPGLPEPPPFDHTTGPAGRILGVRRAGGDPGRRCK
ncbi:hypothetical protein CNMCM5878_009908 [Aspergillus fumigatiaffinis]|nr:hypothetical protein CNMCM5878_009908 [Aspergillus fumigatiaffinis]KAF4239195.1 hypothetical protein CNMCM6457_009239 [Aspergillus fumigatiaffinis]